MMNNERGMFQFIVHHSDFIAYKTYGTNWSK